MYASSTVIGLSGALVMVDGATGWLKRGFPETRRETRPGKSDGMSFMKSHESILLRDRSRDLRVCGNRRGISVASGAWTVSMQFPRSESCSSLGRFARC